MSLKILAVPFSILISLVLIIGFVKPDLALLQERKVSLQTKTSQSQSMTTLLSNIASLVSSLDAQPESERLVQSFLPGVMDQERAIDIFNYLASQTGVLVNVMNMKEIEMKAQPDVVTSDMAVIMNDGNIVETPSLRPKVKAFSAQVEVRGGYENIKDFYSRLAHMNRFHKILNFSIETPDKDSEEAAADGTLIGRFESEFSYFPMQKLSTALNTSVFVRGEFNTAELTELIAWIEYPVAPLKKPLSGRPNPFE